MKAYRESRGIAPLILNLGTRRMLINFTPRLLYPRGHNTDMHRRGGCVGPRAGLDGYGGETYFALQEFELRTFQPLALSQYRLTAKNKIPEKSYPLVIYQAARQSVRFFITDISIRDRFLWDRGWYKCSSVFRNTLWRQAAVVKQGGGWKLQHSRFMIISRTKDLSKLFTAYVINFSSFSADVYLNKTN
jgi:hypothetical protein